MKKLLILLFSILISFNSYGGFFDKTVCVETDTVERGGIIYLINKTKPFSGKDLCKNENGQILTEGKVKKGKFVSKTYNVYYENGYRVSSEYFVTKSETEFSKYQTRWHENGQKSEEFGYKNGKKDGKFTGWYKNGQLKGDSNYKDGKKDGKFIWFYESGRVKSEAIFKDDKCISGDCDYFKDW
jgi:antitoxin component YwqK of YwqJK toxin-antitoxin module